MEDALLTKFKPTLTSLVTDFPDEGQFKDFISTLPAKKRKGYKKKCITEFGQAKAKLENSNWALENKIANLKGQENYKQKYQILCDEIDKLHNLYLQQNPHSNDDDIQQAEGEIENKSLVINKHEALLTKHLLACYEGIKFLFNDIKTPVYVSNFSNAVLQRTQADDIEEMLNLYKQWKLLADKNKSLKSEWDSLFQNKPSNDFQQKYNDLVLGVKNAYTTFNHRSLDEPIGNEEVEEELSIDMYTSEDMLKSALTDIFNRELNEGKNSGAMADLFRQFKIKQGRLNVKLELFKKIIGEIEGGLYQTDYVKFCEQIRCLYQLSKNDKEVDKKPEVDVDEHQVQKLLTFYTTLKAGWHMLNTSSEQDQNFVVAMSENVSVEVVSGANILKLYVECENLAKQIEELSEKYNNSEFIKIKDAQDNFLKQHYTLFLEIERIYYKNKPLNELTEVEVN